MKPSILIVDDHFSICCGLAKLLYNDYTVHRALNGKDALEMYKRHKEIELILTDINMPVMDGFELIKQVRIDNKDIAIIVMTAISTEERIAEIMSIGANHFVKKPLDIPELRLALKESFENMRTSVTAYTNMTDGAIYNPYNI